MGVQSSKTKNDFELTNTSTSYLPIQATIAKKSPGSLYHWIKSSNINIVHLCDYITEFPRDFEIICDHAPINVLKELAPQLSPSRLRALINHSRWLTMKDVLFECVRHPNLSYYKDPVSHFDLYDRFCERLFEEVQSRDYVWIPAKDEFDYPTEN